MKNDMLLRAALALACAAPLCASTLYEPEARTVELAAAPAPPFELAELAELERASGDLEHLRGGDLDLTTGETILIVIGVVILIVLVA